jgi:hypothetical protein
MMTMMKAKKILRPATKMREIMTMMSRNVTGIHTAQLVTCTCRMHISDRLHNAFHTGRIF